MGCYGVRSGTLVGKAGNTPQQSRLLHVAQHLYTAWGSYKMLIVKVVVQIVSVLSTWVIARLDYSYGKETPEFKKGRFGLFTLLLIILLLNVIVTIQDDQEKQREIKELTSKLENITHELTGGDTYAYFMAVPDMGEGDPPTYPLSVSVKGQYPMQNVVAQIQTSYDDPAKQFQSMRTIPLGDGTLPPGVYSIQTNFRVPIGKHIITVRSRSGKQTTQSLVLSASNGVVQQTGDVFRDGKKLRDIPSPY
jgi:hypothetical protein